MPGIAELALGAAPIAGGALVGLAAGNLKGPDFRGMIAKDLDLLDRISADDVERRARLQAIINQRIDDLVDTTNRTHAWRQAAMSYSGNWRDIVLFICAVLFTIVWWQVDHDRANWVVLFVVLIAFSLISGLYALRGVARAIRAVTGGRRR